MKNHQTQHKNFEQTYHEEMSTEGEEEEFPPLPILGPLLTQESEPFLNTLPFKNMNYELGRCLGKHLEMEIEEVFWERMTPELQ